MTKLTRVLFANFSTERSATPSIVFLKTLTQVLMMIRLLLICLITLHLGLVIEISSTTGSQSHSKNKSSKDLTMEVHKVTLTDMASSTLLNMNLKIWISPFLSSLELKMRSPQKPTQLGLQAKSKSTLFSKKNTIWDTILSMLLKTCLISLRMSWLC